MFGFGKKKIDKRTWAALVMPSSKVDPDILSVERLSAATDHVLPQWRGIIMESIEIAQRTKNEETRRGRIALCEKHLRTMRKLKPFVNRQQLAIIEECERAVSGI